MKLPRNASSLSAITEFRFFHEMKIPQNKDIKFKTEMNFLRIIQEESKYT